MATISVSWLAVGSLQIINGNPVTNIFVGLADVGASANPTMDVTIALPSQINPLDFAFLFIQPIGKYTSSVPDEFVTRVVSMDLTGRTANIHIARVDIKSGWGMDLQLNVQLSRLVT